MSIGSKVESQRESSRHARPVIEVLDIHKSYGDVRALNGLSLRVQEGQFVTLLGPSGSGKTTLLQLIAGFLQPDAGRVVARGRDITQLPAHQREFGLVFQHYALFPHMTVRDNIAYPLRVRGVKRRAQDTAVDEYLKLVELQGFGDRFPDELSGGQRQRVALARALVFRPTVLLMDEPLGALDRRLRQSIQFGIKRIQRNLGATVIHVTHDQEEALAMSDVIALMRDGQCEQIGSPIDLYRQPANPFVAGFMGETNRVRVEVLNRQGQRIGLRHVDSGQVFQVNMETFSSDLTTNQKALMCVRPDAVQVAPARNTSQLSGRVASQTFMGDHWRYEVEVGSATIVVRHKAGGEGLHDASISLSFDGDGVQIFPVEGSDNERTDSGLGNEEQYE